MAADRRPQVTEQEPWTVALLEVAKYKAGTTGCCFICMFALVRLHVPDPGDRLIKTPPPYSSSTSPPTSIRTCVVWWPFVRLLPPSSPTLPLRLFSCVLINILLTFPTRIINGHSHFKHWFRSIGCPCSSRLLGSPSHPSTSLPAPLGPVSRRSIRFY